MKKTLIIVIAILLVVIIGGGVVVFSMLKPKEEKIFVYDVKGEPFVTNTKGANNSFVKVSVSLGVNSDKELKDLEAKNGQIRDVIVFVLRNTTKEEFSDPNIKQKLSDQITTKLKEATGLDIFKEVYFSDLVVQ